MAPRRTRKPKRTAAQLSSDHEADREEAIDRFLANGGCIKRYAANGTLMAVYGDAHEDDSRTPGA